MAGGVNKVILMGRLGADPETRAIPSGDTVCEASLATSESWVDKSGEKQERTEWHRLICWGKRGDALAKYNSKGDGLYVEGRIQTRSWEDKEGNKRYRTEIIVTNWEFPPGSSKSSNDSNRRDDSGGGYGDRPPPPSSPDDDIPF